MLMRQLETWAYVTDGVHLYEVEKIASSRVWLLNCKTETVDIKFVTELVVGAQWKLVKSVAARAADTPI